MVPILLILAALTTVIVVTRVLRDEELKPGMPEIPMARGDCTHVEPPTVNTPDDLPPQD